MAKRDILKEAIADAKAVKETAIANAKAALEEAFTPQLKSMLAAKLEEMELEEDAEALEEKKKYKDDDRKNPNPEEKRELKMKEKIKKGSLEEEELDEEINLDEILAEIEGELNEEENIEEDEKTRAEEEGYLDGEEDADKDMEDEEIDLDDMTDDDLKGFIEDVIADMVASGELEAGENFEEEDEETEEVVDTTDVDVEISEMKTDEKVEENEDLGEINTTTRQSYKKQVDPKTGKPIVNPFDLDPSDPRYKSIAGEINKSLQKVGKSTKDLASGVLDALVNVFGSKAVKEIMSESLDEINTTTRQSYKKQVDPKTGKPIVNPFDLDPSDPRYKSIAGEINKSLQKVGKSTKDLASGVLGALVNAFGSKAVKEIMSEDLNQELEEAYSTIESLKSDLNEVNLLNAKLLYTNKIFKAKTLTESQKVKVLGAFDKASTVKESKLVYETLNEGLKAKKAPIKESLGTASRVSGNINTKKPIIETDPMVERFKKLAGLK